MQRLVSRRGQILETKAVRRLVGLHGGWSETELAGCAGHRRRNGAPRRHVANPSHWYLPTYSLGTTTTTCAHVHNDIHISDLKRPANPPHLYPLLFPSRRTHMHPSISNYRDIALPPFFSQSNTVLAWTGIERYVSSGMDWDNSRYSNNRSVDFSSWVHVTCMTGRINRCLLRRQ